MVEFKSSFIWLTNLKIDIWKFDMILLSAWWKTLQIVVNSILLSKWISNLVRYSLPLLQKYF